MKTARDTGRVEPGAVNELPLRPRFVALDERAAGLRATWHLERGFVNLSLWRGDRCVESFHLTPADASRLVGFLVDGLADAAETPRLVGPTVAHAPTQRPGARVDGDDHGTAAAIRTTLSTTLERIAARVRQ